MWLKAESSAHSESSVCIVATSIGYLLFTGNHQRVAMAATTVATAVTKEEFDDVDMYTLENLKGTIEEEIADTSEKFDENSDCIK